MSTPVAKARDAAVEWTVKQLLDRWGLPLLLTLPPALYVWFSGRLLQPYVVQGWAVALAAGTPLALAGVIAALLYRLRRRARDVRDLRKQVADVQEQMTRLRHPPTLIFESRGLRWRITHNFWTMYQSFDAESAADTKTLLGPLCPRCNADVSDDLSAGRMRCGDCDYALLPTVAIRAEHDPRVMSRRNEDPLWPIRKAAYRDAQRRALDGEIRRP
jgi:hypothetical protein